MICTHNGYKDSSGNLVPRIDIDEYPSLKSWFNNGSWNKTPDKTSNLDRLKIRTDKGDTPYNLRDCAYMDDFNIQKIMYSEIVRSPQFYLDSTGFLGEATCFILTGNNLSYLLEYLNSPVVGWCFKRFYAGGGLGDDGYRYKKAFLINLPIPLPAKTTDSSGSLIDVAQSYAFTEDEIKFISLSVNGIA